MGVRGARAATMSSQPDIAIILEGPPSDDIPLKTIVRANPGLVLLKNGVVLKNWHGNDIPSIEEFETFIQ